MLTLSSLYLGKTSRDILNVVAASFVFVGKSQEYLKLKLIITHSPLRRPHLGRDWLTALTPKWKSILQDSTAVMDPVEALLRVSH